MFSRSFFPIYFTPGMFGFEPALATFAPNADGGRGTGVEFEGSNYPFVAPSDNVKHLLADLWIAHYLTDAVGPFHISLMLNFDRVPNGITNLPGQHLTDLVVKDVNNLTILDTRNALAYRGVRFGRRFFIHEWTFSVIGSRVCRAVQHLNLPNNFEGSIPSSIVPDNGILDERTHDLMPARLLSIQVGDEVLSGDIVLQAGWNMEISGNPVSGRGLTFIDTTMLIGSAGDTVVQEQTLQFAAVAGAGEGLYPGCVPTEELGLRTIDTVRPTAKGDFLLNGEACIYVAPPYAIGNPTNIIPNALQIGNHCGQCRPCDAYVSTYRELTDIYNNLFRIAHRAEYDRDQFELLATDVGRAADGCAKAITGAVTGGADFQATTIAVTLQVTNNTKHCYQNLVLEATMGFTGGGSPYIARAGSYKVDEAGKVTNWYDASYPTLSTTWPELIAGATVRIHFVLIWLVPPPGSPPTGTFSLEATAHCDTGDVPVGKTAETFTITEAIS